MNNPADFSAEIWLPPVCQYSLTLSLSLIYIFFLIYLISHLLIYFSINGIPLMPGA